MKKILPLLTVLSLLAIACARPENCRCDKSQVLNTDSLRRDSLQRELQDCELNAQQKMEEFAASVHGPERQKKIKENEKFWQQEVAARKKELGL